MKEVKLLIEKFGLVSHPEGGYFKETYRSSEKIDADTLPPRFQSSRDFSTCIYFLLTSDTFSAFHKIKQDEIWHFYAGSPIKLYMISELGNLTEHLIGNDFSSGQVPQFVVPANYWFAAKTIAPNNYSFVGCTVTPGFDFDDFELPSRNKLIGKFPQHKEIIAQLTRV